MTKALRIFFSSVFVIALAFVAGGIIIWISTAKSREFYSVNAFTKEAPVNLWIQYPSPQTEGGSNKLQRVSISLWLNPKHIRKALVHFDEWLQEYLLVLEETDEAAQDDPHLLPPVPTPPEDEDEFDADQDEAVYLEHDPYDLAFAKFLADVWQSGLLTLAGSAYFDLPFWAKPLSGWLVAAAQSRFSPYIFDSLIDGFIVRSDGADLPSWFDAVPRAQVELQAGETFVREAIVDLGGRELADLFGRLCELENLSDDYCSDIDPVKNPLSPLLAVSENFQIQLNVFWTLRGQHLLWSNNRECLLSLLQSGASGHCSEADDNGESQQYLAGHQLRRFAKSIETHSQSSAGFLFNQSILASKVEKILTFLSHSTIDGASWLEDFFNSSSGEVFLRRVRELLAENANGSKLWGAEIVYLDSGTSILVNSFAPSSGHAAEEFFRLRGFKPQFDFLNSLMSAWMGVPHSTGRLAETKPWVKKNEHWRTESLYRLGWSEQE